MRFTGILQGLLQTAADAKIYACMGWGTPCAGVSTVNEQGMAHTSPNAKHATYSMQSRRHYQAGAALSTPCPPLRRSVTGRYHTVTCLDVMIHYPQVNRLVRDVAGGSRGPWLRHALKMACASPCKPRAICRSRQYFTPLPCSLVEWP